MMKYSTNLRFVFRISQNYIICDDCIIFDHGFCSSTIWSDFEHLKNVGDLIDLMIAY